MKVSLRLAELLTCSPRRRGLVAEISSATGIDRHSVSALLNNGAEYISLDALGRLCEYLIDYHKIDARRLPGALFGRDPDRLWDLLAGAQQLHFCLGTRRSKEWHGAEYVMSTDSRLQGLMLSMLSHAARPHDASPVDSSGGLRAEFHLVPSPPRDAPRDSKGQWSHARREAETLYAELQQQNGSACLFLGSGKVNPAVELTLARAWSAAPFVTQDDVKYPADRSCPIFFRYRDDDPKPDSFCGGMKLAKRGPVIEPGIHYEQEGKLWKACPCNPADSDAAYIFFAYYPNTAHAEVACGGFSSRATNCLTRALEEIVKQIPGPQYTSRTLDVGLYVVHFTFDAGNTDYDRYRDNRPFQTNVIGLSPKVIERRLARHTDV